MERILRVCTSPSEADEIDLDEWLALSGDERVAIGEQMREEAWPDIEPRLQRLLRVAEQPER